MDIPQFINLHIEGNVGSFRFLAVTNKAAINMSARFFMDDRLSVSYKVKHDLANNLEIAFLSIYSKEGKTNIHTKIYI